MNKFIWTAVLLTSIFSVSCQRKNASVETPSPTGKSKSGGSNSGDGSGGSNSSGINAGGSNSTSDTDSTVTIQGKVDTAQVNVLFGASSQLTYRFYVKESSSSSSSGNLPSTGVMNSLTLKKGTYTFGVEVTSGANKAYEEKSAQQVSYSTTITFSSLKSGAAPGGGGGGGTAGGGSAGGGNAGGGNAGGGNAGGGTAGSNSGQTDIDIQILFGTWKGDVDQGNSRWNIK